jgi:recombination protein RecA
MDLPRFVDLRAAQESQRNQAWELAALRGRLVEVSGRGASATTTAAIELVVQAQMQAADEPVAWISIASSTFYPPDAAASGVDLAALVVIRAPDALAAVRTTENLLSSGGFGLLVLDLVASDCVELPMRTQGKFVKLAQAHDATVVCLTQKPAAMASLGSLVSLRMGVKRSHNSDDGARAGKFAIDMHALKDKRRGPGWTQRLVRRGPLE